MLQNGDQYYSLCRLPQSERSQLTELTINNAPWLKQEATCEHKPAQSSDCLDNEERFATNKNLCGCKQDYYRNLSLPKSNGCKKCPIGHTCAGGFSNGKHAQPVIVKYHHYVDSNDGTEKHCSTGKCDGRGFFFENGYYSSVCCKYITNNGREQQTPVPPIVNHREVYRHYCDLLSCKGCQDGSYRFNGECKECSGDDWLGYRCPGAGKFQTKDQYYKDSDPYL